MRRFGKRAKHFVKALSTVEVEHRVNVTVAILGGAWTLRNITECAMQKSDSLDKLGEIRIVGETVTSPLKTRRYLLIPGSFIMFDACLQSFPDSRQA